MKRSKLAVFFLLSSIVASANAFSPQLTTGYLEKKDYESLTAYLSMTIPDKRQVFEMGKKNPILKAIDSGDLMAIDIFIAAKYPMHYFEPNMSVDGQDASLPFYCLVTHNLDMLKKLYALGFRLNGEGKDVLLISESTYDAEDILGAIERGNDDELLLFVWKNETNKYKYYSWASGHTADSSIFPLINTLLHRPDFIHLVELLGIQYQINSISEAVVGPGWGNELHSLLDGAKRTLEEEKKTGKNTVDMEAKLAYIVAHGGLPTKEALRLLTRKQASIIKYGDGICTAGELFIRDAPDTTSGRTIGRLFTNEQVIVLEASYPRAFTNETNIPWYLVLTDSGLIGYCYGAYMKVK
jgi:hypothetical protein